MTDTTTQQTAQQIEDEALNELMAIFRALPPANRLAALATMRETLERIHKPE
jgi:hypothetical protein